MLSRKPADAVSIPATELPSPTALPSETAPSRSAADDLISDAWRYPVDFWQRSVLFLDALRERANIMLEHEQAGSPPVLGFEYETLLDARTFERPVNYVLLRITVCGDACAADCIKADKRPVIIFDPRAGHGPGIGGFKRESEVGMALKEGHPVYFVGFFPEPCPHQTLADVLRALNRFVEEVANRHREVGTPVLYGNCQAGWAVALLAADCTGNTGPAVLNGSPLSYWAGEERVNPMRLLGGLLGGAWPARLLADLGNGTLDGAWLVQNFEHLNPANSLWDKYYQLFAHVEEERERFLAFERWWGGFYFFTKEEFTAIVENLFIGNKPERGEMLGLCRICEGCFVDLKKIRSPLVIFASSADNITPPHQALNWIPAVYPSTEALKSAGQRIVYLLNTHVGHLGIFVSARVARLEHRAILESVDELEALQPGLYEMKILNPTGDPDCCKPQYTVTFEERRVEDLRFDYPREAFAKVWQVSEVNTALYETFAGPWVRTLAAPWSAAMPKWLHPMRMSRYLYSERFNPQGKIIKILLTTGCYL
jgi:pimeloyl-ACP methyl ester carboxylesterase